MVVFTVTRMNRRFQFWILVSACLVLLPFQSPAPLIYTPGEGWVYVPVGEDGGTQRLNAREQIIVAQEAFDQKDYGLALRAARRTVRMWPLSDYSAQAQYLVGRCYEVRGQDEKAFKEFQALIQKYPQAVNYDEVLTRQYEIANRFLEGQWFKLWDIVPFFPSMEKTAGLFETVVTNGPYSQIAPQAQMKIGEAREKQGNYPAAVKAYERAADRYNDRPIASDALFSAAQAYTKQAQTAEYDQSTAGLAIATFTDFLTLYPNDSRRDVAEKVITQLRTEQARGNFETARYYEKNRKWRGALVYYNEVLIRDPSSPYADSARERIEALQQRLQTARN
jgi:outer membrane protein assembly factor BamD